MVLFISLFMPVANNNKEVQPGLAWTWSVVMVTYCMESRAQFGFTWILDPASGLKDRRLNTMYQPMRARRINRNQEKCQLRGSARCNVKTPTPRHSTRGWIQWSRQRTPAGGGGSSEAAGRPTWGGADPGRPRLHCLLIYIASLNWSRFVGS